MISTDVGAAVRRVLDEQRRPPPSAATPIDGRERERAGPAELGERERERRGGDDRAHLADLAGELGDQRRLADQEPRPTTSRITLTKIIASPAPSTARAPTATGNDVANANTSCPAVISTSPVRSIARDPNRSSSTPIGICMPAYTTSWSTVKNASCGRLDLEPVGREQAGDAERAAVEDREDVDRQARPPR